MSITGTYATPQQRIPHHEKPNVRIDVQSLLQTLAILLTLAGYAFKQNDRLTTLEVKQQVSEKIVDDIAKTQQTLVKLFNEHLVNVAGNGAEAKNFKDLEDKLMQMEKEARILGMDKK